MSFKRKKSSCLKRTVDLQPVCAEFYKDVMSNALSFSNLFSLLESSGSYLGFMTAMVAFHIVTPTLPLESTFPFYFLSIVYLCVSFSLFPEWIFWVLFSEDQTVENKKGTVNVCLSARLTKHRTPASMAFVFGKPLWGNIDCLFVCLPGKIQPALQLCFYF